MTPVNIQVFFLCCFCFFFNVKSHFSRFFYVYVGDTVIEIGVHLPIPCNQSKLHIIMKLYC